MNCSQMPAPDDPNGITIAGFNATILRIIYDAISEVSVLAPAALGLARAAQAVEKRELQDYLKSKLADSLSDDEDQPKEGETDDQFRKRVANNRSQNIKRARDYLIAKGVLGHKNDWYWLTGKKVRGFEAAPGQGFYIVKSTPSKQLSGVLKIKTTFERITPDLAAHILKFNKSNRPLNVSRAREYSEIMKNGRWQDTHQGIAIGIDGVLLDGQHRLSAIVMSGVSIWMNVTRDMPYDSAFGLQADIGARRTAAEVYQVRKEISATCAAIQYFHEGRSHGVGRTGDFISSFGPHASRVIPEKFSRRRGVSHGIFLAAATVTAIKFGCYDEIRSIIKNMSLDNYDDLHPSQKSYLKAEAHGRIKYQDKVGHFGKSLAALDPTNFKSDKIFASQERIDWALNVIRTTFSGRGL